MIIKCDAKQLEWRTYLELSRDAVGVQEVFAKVDQHTVNQNRFALPSRLIAKKFLFRWIYRGPPFAYANDQEFMPTSSSVDFWADVIEKANKKYYILHEFQNKMIYEAKQGKKITIPSGRWWVFKPKMDKNGFPYYKDTDISNWPNQGFAADVTMIIRRLLYKNLANDPDRNRIKVINTVHDDVELDIDNDPVLAFRVCCLLEDVFKDIHNEFYRLFNYDLMVPYEGEVSFGKNLLDLTEFHREKGVEQYANAD